MSVLLARQKLQHERGIQHLVYRLVLQDIVLIKKLPWRSLFKGVMVSLYGFGA